MARKASPAGPARYTRYIVVVYNTRPITVKKLLRFLEKHGRIEAVAVMVVVEDGRVLGAIRKIVGKEWVASKGYLPLPRP